LNFLPFIISFIIPIISRFFASSLLSQYIAFFEYCESVYTIRGMSFYSSVILNAI
jgi:hypothetical protein